MPELPEVETTRLGLLPLVKQTVKSVTVRNPSLRWPIPKALPALLENQTLQALERRAKYILARFDSGTLLIHLGMSGHISLLDRAYPPEKHDHFDIVFHNQHVLRLTDPRRFGAVLWAGDEPYNHELLTHLGPEPLLEGFSAEYLYQQTRTRKGPIKNIIMDAKLVVGVGNIYANESLFRAKINPQLPANRLTKKQCERFVNEIKLTLAEALEAGGSSLRDFTAVNGRSGYFQQRYNVYGRAGEPCRVCQLPITCIRLGQRSTFFCKQCQQ